MQDKLRAIPDDALIELKQRVDEEFKRRRPNLLRVGRQATFESSKTGETVRILITGKGPKNYLGTRCDEYGNPIGGRGAQWRVHPDFLTPVLPKKAPPPKQLGVGNDRPAAAPVASW